MIKTCVENSQIKIKSIRFAVVRMQSARFAAKNLVAVIEDPNDIKNIRNSNDRL